MCARSNELYSTCCQLAADIMKESDGENRDAIGEDLSDAWDALNDFLKAGGELPDAWR